MSDEAPRRPIPSNEEIVGALRSAGWLLEHDTTTVLRRRDFFPTMGKAYQDPDQPETSREIDVVAFRQFLDLTEEKFQVNTRVIAECKASAAPYVLVGQPVERHERSQSPKEHVLPFPTVSVRYPSRDGGPGYVTNRPTWDLLRLGRLPGGPDLDGFRASQMTRLDIKNGKWLADNRGIFSSLVYPLAKALTAFQKEIRPADINRGFAQVALFFPVVVTTAPLYVLDATSEDLEPQERPWARMSRDLKSASLAGRFEVDVVNFAYLDDWLGDRVVQFATSVADLVREEPDIFRRMDMDAF